MSETISNKEANSGSTCTSSNKKQILSKDNPKYHQCKETRMETFVIWMCLALLSVVVYFVFFFMSLAVNTQAELKDFEQEAFDRGYMVQCLGKEGYYWECE